MKKMCDIDLYVSVINLLLNTRICSHLVIGNSSETGSETQCVNQVNVNESETWFDLYAS